MNTKYFAQYQTDWVFDLSPLKIMQKSRQIGITYADAYNSVMLASDPDARLDVYVSSRDEVAARLYLEDCKFWADFLHSTVTDLGEIDFDTENSFSAYALHFSNGRRIYSLSSNPNALAGKRGHVKLDEFALHKDQRLLYRIAKPVTMWGGSLSLISTHRGAGTLFNQIILKIKSSSSSYDSSSFSSSITGSLGIPAGQSPTLDFRPETFDFGSCWSLHTVPIQKAVEQGIVERINKKTGRNESREAFLNRIRKECIDEEQWLQEYCCTPADESAAFFSYEMLDACTDPNLKLLSLESLLSHSSHSSHSFGRPTLDFRPETLDSLYLGIDIARSRNLCVIDIGQKKDSIMTDLVRLELHNQSFTEIENQLFPILALPQLKRACIDDSGMGQHLAERARERFGWKVEPIRFTAPKKEELAFALRRDFEDRCLRIPNDDSLRADLRALKKEITPTGKLRFIGDVENSHCDRTWSKALRQHSARKRSSAGCIII
jgi:phage FluMu gp28-like protein